MLVKVISGGQSGIDRMSLEVARELDILTGGSAPEGFLTEDAPDPSLKEFGLLTLPNKANKARTLKNVIDGDGTVIYGDLTGGTQLTAEFCERENKPYIVNPKPDDLAAFVRKIGIRVLNVAGNRGSKLTPERLQRYRKQFRDALQLIIGLEKP
jgi:hypothetical protein